VRRLGGAARIAEKCLDLQQGGARPKRAAAAAAPAPGAAGGAGAAGQAARTARAASGCPFLGRKASSRRHLKARARRPGTLVAGAARPAPDTRIRCQPGSPHDMALPYPTLP